ncbi:MAG: hypothetical protein MMC33_006846 [Icmadophila ericetorum]|nr:hypothetical protein [Icmadophila ericetorum]
MSFPPLRPPSENSFASSTSQPLSVGSARTRQSAWGLPAPTAGTHRGLTPLATNVGATTFDLSTRRPGPSNSPSINTNLTFPFAPTFSSVLNSSTRVNISRNPSSASSSAPPFTPLQTGSQQPHPIQLLASPRSRGNTSLSTSNLASSAAASTTASSGGGGGGGSTSGGGTSRPAAFSPSLSTQSLNSPTSATFDRTPFTSSASVTTPTNQSVSKIVVTQVFLLLGSITEKEGKAKWDSQADAIRKLVESHGMEVFAKYFRRLLVGNSPQIFPGINRNVENPGNYQLLVQEMEKTTQDPEQANRIAETIDTSDGDLFRDFDLATFMNHFKLDPVAKMLLASAFTHVTKTDLKTKAESILKSNYQFMLESFANLHNNEHDIAPSLLATTAFRFLRDLPESSKDGTEKNRIYHSFQTRYSRQGLTIPAVIRSAMVLTELLDSQHEVAKDLQRQGPNATESVDTAKGFLRNYSNQDLNEEQISGALLFMILTPDWETYRPSNFVSAVRETVDNNFNWQIVVRGFDRNGLAIMQDQFLALYNALLPIAQDNTEFDIQQLWGGQWQYPATQLSFVLALTSLLPSKLDATTIPGLRQAYDPNDCSDGPEDVVRLVDAARRSTLISVDAVTAIFDIVWDVEDPLTPEDGDAAKEVVGANMGFFLCSAAGIPKSWTPTQESIMSKMLVPYLLKQQPDYSYVLHCLWKQDKHWLANRLIETHLEDPMKLPILLEHAYEHGWLDDLCTMMNGFGIDLAALAHRRGYLDIEQWAHDKILRMPGDFATSVSKFLIIKAQDEQRTVRGTVSLAMKTVYVLLEILGEQMKDRNEELIALERQCIQAFPRLINYGEGFDDVIEASGEENNSLSDATDAEMQDLYKRMYNNELDVRQIVEVLQDYKTSRESSRQDLFACMIHGLFDEYVCFNEYPLVPLATTAVLFGGIISYKLINNLTLHVGLEMVLEAVRDYGPETSMYKFGLQALMNFQNRLHEWPEFCRQLAQMPHVQGTEIHTRVQQILHENNDPANHIGEMNGINGLGDGINLTNGDVDAFLSADMNVQKFRSVYADVHTLQDPIEEPEEQVQDKVLFVLNNVSEQNISTKITDLTDVLDTKYHSWFASYLVEQRAKLQPNYQQLYLDLLKLLGSRKLWNEVLRETYIAVQKILNAESTMNAPVERTHLKNLGTWLGTLTIARDKPIKQKYISFKDLLIEGWETQRLILVIPFICAVLTEGKKSIVFKPPNPWLMEIIALLLELYDTPEIKINQKFAIEILLTDFGLPKDGVGMERSTELKQRQEQYEEEMRGLPMSDGLNGFDDMSIAVLTKGVRNARFSPAAIASALPDLGDLLTFPPSSGSTTNQARLRQVVLAAVQRAIVEIIAPVVERSVTIATIATRDLIHKDFARESDEERVRQASQRMARALAGSLALVTSKEPLRMSMMNYIRMMQGEAPEQTFPEGAILMCVNDNLDIACGIVEKQAEERCMPEIEAHIETEINQRRQHRLEFPNDSYQDPSFSAWSNYIPDPYKILPGGLQTEQMEIYLTFARQSRGPAAHLQTSSTDSGRQIPDVLQSDFPSVPNLPTPAETPAITHQTVQQPHPQGRMLPPPASTTRAISQMNGYPDAATVQDHIQELMAELSRLSKDASEKRFKDLAREDPILEIIGRVQHLIVSSSLNLDAAAMNTASLILPVIYGTGASVLEVEVLVHLLHRLCQISLTTAKEVVLLFRNQDDEKLFNVPVTVALLESGLIDFSQVDITLAKALHQEKLVAVDCLRALLHALLLSESPIALRADFASSLGALGQWYSHQPDLPTANEIMSKLKEASMPEDLDANLSEPELVKRNQMQYIFMEWMGLCSHPEPNDGMFVAFITQLHQRQVVNSQDDMVLFLRLCIDDAVLSHEREEGVPGTDPDDAYFTVDALARLVVLLVKNQGELNGAVKGSKPSYMNSILSLLILILNNHHVLRGEQFNQRLFFRLFSSILYDWHEFVRMGNAQDRDMILVFADNFLLLDPRYFPAFTYGWLSLISHRCFMPAVLKHSDDEGCEPFAKIIECMLSHVSELLKPTIVPPVAKELYRGVLRILLILHHDFPEFLAENHYRFCNIIPPYCTQLRNLVLSAYPSSFPELPDPFSPGLKVDRLEETRKAPIVAGDIEGRLEEINLKSHIDDSLKSGHISDEIAHRVIETAHVTKKGPDQATLLNAMVLYIGQKATEASSLKGGPTFSPESPQAMMLSKLAKELDPEARYYFLGALVNQLRYPNSHTHYFSYALLHLFGSDLNDQEESDVRQQIARILLERLIVHRPHPWGLIITLLELLKNQVYMFWELPFIKAAPEAMKLFQALFQHINQSPRTLA